MAVQVSKRVVWLLLFALAAVTAQAQGVNYPDQTTPHERALWQLAPAAGRLLHGVYPGGKTGYEDDITPQTVRSYTKAVGRPVAWVMFSNNWFSNRSFPMKKARWIRQRDATPYIRLMLRSDTEQDHREPLFTLDAILRGDFDADLTKWGQQAAKFATPVISEYGTEMNGQWFSWNARWNGRAQGAKRFRDAYRHIIEVTRAAGASNIIWVFHVNNADYPLRSWNRFEQYYPGNDYIDWLGVSIYSMQAPYDTEKTSFVKTLPKVMARFAKMAPEKPVIVAEFGTDVHNRRERAAKWADGALSQMLSRRWPTLIGFSWWNETWENDDDPARNTDMQVQSSGPLARVFRKHLITSQVQNHP